MALSDSQIFDIARMAGFPADVATQMVAIALRESGGNPNAHNTTPPDDSYGLWQINMYGAAAPARLALFGISDASQLFDPNVNARAAFILWGGNPANLNTAWAINKTGPPYYYAEKYQGFLPRAQAAAASSPLGSPVILASGGGGDTSTGDMVPADSSPPSFPSGRPMPAPPARPAGSMSAPGGTRKGPLPKWLSDWWRARFSSRSLANDAGLAEAVGALVAIYGAAAVRNAVMDLEAGGRDRV